MKSKPLFCLAASAAIFTLCIPAVFAQWPTYGHDPQRSGWAKNNHVLTPSSVTRLRLVWRTRLPNPPRSLSGLMSPLVTTIERQGRRQTMVIASGSSNRVFALDAGTGRLLWQSYLHVTAPMPGAPMWLCPNSANDTPVLDPARQRMFVIAADGRLFTLSLLNGRPLQPPLRFVPPYAKMWSLNYSQGWLYTSVSQDCNQHRSGVYAMDPDQPGHPVTTFWSSQACANGFCGAGIWGRGGVTIGRHGAIYATTGDAPFNPAGNEFGDTFLRLKPQRLALSNYFTPPDWRYITRRDLDIATTSPMLFSWHGMQLSAFGGKQGLIDLVNTAAPGGPGHHRDLYTSPVYSNAIQTFQQRGIWGELSVWKDAHSGATYIYVPAWGPLAPAAAGFPRSYGQAPDGSILALRVVASAPGKPVLQPAWRSRDLAVPEPVAVADGVVFALATGENTEQVHGGDIHRIIVHRSARPHGHATLYALDARSGRTLWSSGHAIRGWMHFTGLAIAGDKVFLATHAGTVYAFGLHSLPLNPARAASGGLPPLQVVAPLPGAAPAVSKTKASAAYTPVHAASSISGSPACRAAQPLFQAECSMCHGANGKGFSSIGTPDFTSAAWQKTHTDAQLKAAITHGLGGAGHMPAYGHQLSAAQIDALARCVIRGFGAKP